MPGRHSLCSPYLNELLEPRRLLAAFGAAGVSQAPPPLPPGPDLAWSSYLGSGAGSNDGGIALDASGNAWVTGSTSSSGWAVGGFDTTYNGGSGDDFPFGGDAFIAKINADGTLAWSSYLGGTGIDNSRDIAIDGSGNAWVTGYTESSGWAVGGFDTSYNGGFNDAFIAKINADGTLAWSSYLGGTANDQGHGIAIDGSGNAWVTGGTNSSGWAVGGFDTSYNGNGDAFVAKINADGTLAWSSYLGGTSGEGARGIAIDGSGSAWVTGATTSSGWAVGGFDTSYNGGFLPGDAFVAKINATGTLAWSSYLGGTSGDFGSDIALDGSGNAWVTGATQGGGWAVRGFDTSFDGTNDAFIAKIRANGTLDWSSYLGGTTNDYGFDIAIDGSGNAWVTGGTDSSDWAVGGFDTSYNGAGGDAFIAKINAAGTLAWSSYLGGTLYVGHAIAIDGSGNAWVTGATTSSGWTVGGFDTSFNSGGRGYNAFVAKITNTDVTPPKVDEASYIYETSPNKLRLRFTEDVSASLAASDLIVTAVPGGAPVSVTNVAFDSGTRTATFDLLTPLADGNYSARLPAASVTDLIGHPLAADYTLDFFVFAGDANRDRTIDIADFAIVAGRFNQPGTFSQGDFNYSGLTDIGDFAILASKFNTSLPAPAILPRATVATGASQRQAASPGHALAASLFISAATVFGDSMIAELLVEDLRNQ